MIDTKREVVLGGLAINVEALFCELPTGRERATTVEVACLRVGWYLN